MTRRGFDRVLPRHVVVDIVASTSTPAIGGEWETDHGKRSANRVVDRVEFLAAPRNGNTPAEHDVQIDVADFEPAAPPADDDIPF
ncbi:MAG: hypothetical protein ACLP0J_03585 [Solirubrobacteraceae bacterium]